MSLCALNLQQILECLSVPTVGSWWCYGEQWLLDSINGNQPFMMMVMVWYSVIDTYLGFLLCLFWFGQNIHFFTYMFLWTLSLQSHYVIQDLLEVKFAQWSIWKDLSTFPYLMVILQGWSWFLVFCIVTMQDLLRASFVDRFGDVEYNWLSEWCVWP
jgi:hypothetical protein